MEGEGGGGMAWYVAIKAWLKYLLVDTEVLRSEAGVELPAFAVMWRQGTSFIGDRSTSVRGFIQFRRKFRVETGTE